MDKPFSLLVKPASADCNLKCDYCFYLDHCSFYPESKKHRMSEVVLERMISTYMSTRQPNYAFGWQGGEPTLMGLDFFKKVTELQQKHGRSGVMVSNGLQTNGTLIDDAMAEHFGKYQFLLGVSVDGPEYVHDHYRRNRAGQGSHATIMRNIERLRQHNVEFNILVLVNQFNVDKATEIYTWFMEQGFHYLQFIPCVEFDQDNKPLPFAINGEQWGDFLCEIYDIWHKTDTRKVSIRFFDSLLNLLVHGTRNVCHIGDNCCQYFVVEHNGDIFPCDFFVRKELVLGNIMDMDWSQALKSERYHEFGRQKAEWSALCSKCQYCYYCMGDCLKHRTYGTITDPANLSWLCAGRRKFLKHTLSGFQRLADEIRLEHNIPAPAVPHPNPASKRSGAKKRRKK